MTKNEYIQTLKNALVGHEGADMDEILGDVEQHFDDAMAAGLSEQSVCDSLGDPMELASEFLRGMPKSAQATATLGTQRGDYEGVGQLTVELGYCDIEVYPSTDEKSYIDIYDTATIDEERIEVIFENGHLMIRQRRKYGRFLAFFGVHNDKCRARIWLGEGFHGDIKASSGSGSVKALQLTGGDIKLSAGSGTVSAEAVTARKLSLNAASGAVKALNLKADEVSMNTASGGISCDGLEAPILKCNVASGGINVTKAYCGDAQFNTASGSITFDCYKKCAVSARTASGSVKISLPRDQQMTVTTRTASGGVDIGFPSTCSGDKGRKVFVVGDGSMSVNCATASGSIRVMPL